MKNSHLDRRTQYSLNAIRQALLELLEQKALGAITVTDICRIADINRGTFYKYYRDVPDLYDQIENEFVEKIHALFVQRQGAEKRSQGFFRSVLTILSENSDLLQIAKGSAASERVTQKLMVFFIPYVREMTRRYYPNISEERSALFTEYILGGCTRVVTYWLNSGMSIPLETVESTLIDLSERSLRSHPVPEPPGRQ